MNAGGRNALVSHRETPIIGPKYPNDDTAFSPDDLLREARRQKAIEPGSVPEICVLDPDGDIVSHLVAQGRAAADRHWACYHTDLYRAVENGATLGFVPRVVGGPFAVLVAEQLFASGCRLLVSVTSAGQIVPVRDPPYFVLISRALRDEGTSYHYLPAARYSDLAADLVELVDRAFADTSAPMEKGPSWTTDAPYRETERAIAERRDEGILAVEMEAASLYAFAEAKRKPVICFAHITNQMGAVDGDFEKGEDDGSRQALEIVARVARAWSDEHRG